MLSLRGKEAASRHSQEPNPAVHSFSSPSSLRCHVLQAPRPRVILPHPWLWLSHELHFKHVSQLLGKAANEKPLGPNQGLHRIQQRDRHFPAGGGCLQGSPGQMLTTL